MSHEFTAGFLFAGLGAGARGFIDAAGKLGKSSAHFRNLGGIDNDPLACQDFETLTGGPSLCADLSKMKPDELRAAWGNESPDCVFMSPPCKGFSGLLPAKSANAPKYQALNRLVLQGMFLACETWDRPPALLVLENVPRISTRGAPLLVQVRNLLSEYGYVFSEGYHDCGEIGGLAQHRRRFLMVARLPKAVPAYVYLPPKHRVRACGEVLGELPMPEDTEAGELHKLPRLSWLNWVRLALIPAGGDWRDLPGPERFGHVDKVTEWNKPAGTVTASPAPSSGGGAVADPRINGRNGKRYTDQYKVRDWEKPAGTVTGNTDIQEGAQSVADPRIAIGKTGENAGKFKGRPGFMGVQDWEKPTPAVTGTMQVSGGHGTAAVADPRLSTPLAPGQKRRSLWQRQRVMDWDKPSAPVAGPGGSNGAFAIADPRLEHEPFRSSFGVTDWKEPAATVRGTATVRTGTAAVAEPRMPGSLGVTPWSEPAKTVTGENYPSNGRNAVADPRLGLGADNPDRHWNKYAVGSWEEPARTVTGTDGRVGSGAPSVADPRMPKPEDVAFGCRFRGNGKGPYGVLSWEQAAATITGSAQVDNGTFAVADPRKPPEVLPVIVAKDGTWHRPLTTLELAALQGIPAKVNGKPLALAGRSIAKWRERIGNAVPVGAASAIAASLLTALLAAKLGTWMLGSEGIWVRAPSQGKARRTRASFKPEPLYAEVPND